MQDITVKTIKPRIDSSRHTPARGLGLFLLLLASSFQPSTAHAQGTAFTYQGRLNVNGTLANGGYDLQFIVYDNSIGGNQQGPVLTSPAVAVNNGLFTTTLDFGAGVFTGPDRWLDISVRTNGAASFTPLPPRQKLAPTPYSITAHNLTGTLPVSQVTGTIPQAQLPASVVLNGASGVTLSGTFSGNGSGLTSLNAGNLSNGTVPDSLLSANVASRSSGNTFTGSQFINGYLHLGGLSGFEQDSAGPFYIDAPFFVGGRFTVLTNGNVGLGTANPASKLEVDGNTTVTGALGVSGTATLNGALNVSGNTTLAGNTALNGNATVAATSTLSFGAQTRQMLNLFNTDYGIGVQSGTMYFRSQLGCFGWYAGGVHDDRIENPGTGGTSLMILDAPSGNLFIKGGFGSLSDRNAKQGFEPVDTTAVLDKVAALPLSRWSYKTDPSVRHLGPMAQDFFAAFEVGHDDKHIMTVDEDGVALAAIQGLNRKLEETRAENEELKRRLTTLEQIILKQKSN